MSKPIIEVNNVSFQYGEQKVLENIQLDILKGDFLGLVGPNGSGKSTLLKIILGLIQPTSGEVRLFGKPVSKFNNWSKIGYVSQKANSFNRGFPASVEEIVLTGLYGELGIFKRVGKTERDRVRDALKQVGLSDLGSRNIAKLSGGQQQRAFIARAIVSNPEVIILDEPTVGVDIESVNQFYQLMGQLNESLGLTIMLVSHDIGTITEKVTKLACLNKKLFCHGSPQEMEDPQKTFEKTFGEDVNMVTHHHH